MVMEVMVASLHLPPPRATRANKACIASSRSRSERAHSSARPPNAAPQLSYRGGGRATSMKAWPVAFVLGLAVVLCPGPYSDAHAFNWFGNSSTIEKDPVEPFTLYGSVFKKYFIENIVDGKVVSRKKGFTSTACVNALDAAEETPELQGIPAGLKVIIIGEPLCSKSEGQTREETCLPSCKSACARAISRHLAEVTKETGYVLDSKDMGKVVESCSNQCNNECLKPGKTTSFIYPFRPSK